MAISEPSKPRLYLDIDGVIYGWYGGQWQIRPYVATLIEWAKEHFDVKWLSFNMRDELIGKVCYAELTRTDMSHDGDDPDSALKSKWEKVRGITNDGGLDGDWLIIEDTPPTLEGYEELKKHNSLHKWILVPETGSDVLMEVKLVLERYLETGKLRVPGQWAKANYLDKSLCLLADWQGPSVKQCEPQ